MITAQVTREEISRVNLSRRKYLTVIVLLLVGDVALRRAQENTVEVEKALKRATCPVKGFERPCRVGVGLGITFFGLLDLRAWNRSAV